MHLKAAVVAIAGGIFAVGMYGPPATAATTQGFSGRAESSVPGCPYLAWRLVKHASGDITGIAYYSDLSGLSQVTGSGNGEAFNLVLTPTMGNGPKGTVAGTRSSRGGIVADMRGEGCANMHLTMMPLTDVNRWTNVGGGGG